MMRRTREGLCPPTPDLIDKARDDTAFAVLVTERRGRYGY